MTTDTDHPAAQLTKTELTSRNQEMAHHVRTALSYMRPGMRIRVDSLLPRLPEDFLMSSYPDRESRVNAVQTVLKAVVKEGALLSVSGDEFMLHGIVEITPPPPINKTRMASLHMRRIFLKNGGMDELMAEASAELRAAYASESALKTGFKMIVNRIIVLSDDDFAKFYENLDADRPYASPFQGLGSPIGKSPSGDSGEDEGEADQNGD